MGATGGEKYRKGPYDITDYQTTHLCGGAIMGTDPKLSAVNRYCRAGRSQSFVMGASGFPQNAGYIDRDPLRPRLLVAAAIRGHT